MNIENFTRSIIQLHYVAKFVGQGHSLAHFQAFHFSLKTRCPPSMLLFDMKCLVSHHSPNNTDSGEVRDDPHNVKESGEINVSMQGDANKTLMSQQFCNIL